jgi:hypothetical protein
MWGQVRFCELSADGVTEECVEVNHLWDKSHQCKFKNTKPRDKHEACPRIYTNPNDDLCPYRFMIFYRGLCMKTQERELCFGAIDKQLKKWKKTNQPYLYNPNNPVGENTVRPLCKERYVIRIRMRCVLILTIPSRRWSNACTVRRSCSSTVLVWSLVSPSLGECAGAEFLLLYVRLSV